VSVGAKAVSGVAWTILTGGSARLLGLVGTMVLTYFIAPDVAGDISAASIAVITANQFSQLGVGTYLIANAKAPRSVAWHASVIHLSLGAVALVGVLLLRHRLGVLFHTPRVTEFLPGLALAMAMERVAFIPERILARDLRFRRLGFGKAAGEAALPIVAVTAAVLGYGGMSLVFGNLARSIVNLVNVLAAVDRRDWLEVGRIHLSTIKMLASYGFLVAVGALMAIGARKWDNLLVAHIFGDWTMGLYNQAYNLADVPAIQVGEQITDVLLASLANLDPERRQPALMRATALIALVMFPLSVGLGVTGSTLVRTFLAPAYAGVGPMLMLLAGLSVTRPIANAVQSYMMVRNRTRAFALLETFNVVAIVVSLSTIGRASPLWACGAIGVAFLLRLVVTMYLVWVTDQISPLAIIGVCWRPLVACVPLVGAVLGVRHGIALLHLPRGVPLALEVMAGALAYVIAALMVAPAASHELLEHGLRFLGRGVAPNRAKPDNQVDHPTAKEDRA
jgi:PST family polysaccharide transporter